MTEKTILVDLDDTVLAYSDDFQLWMEERGHFSHRRLKNLYYVEEAFGITQDTAIARIREFEKSDRFGHLRAEPDARIVIADLRRRGFRFVAVTAASCGTTEVRRSNLLKEFGFSWDVHCVGLYASKQDILSRFDPTYWIDDHLKHAGTGADCGHVTFLMDRQHNRSLVDARIHRVDDWFRIRDHILEAEGLRRAA
jgi:5'(3')-deoxyribonucleotidase